jgi:hypothetical protein
MMKKNMGTVDKTVRVLIAVVFIGLYFANVITGTVGIALLMFAGVFILTSFISFCPLYYPFGFFSNKRMEDRT